jgi:hypothetical protein
LDGKPLVDYQRIGAPLVVETREGLIERRTARGAKRVERGDRLGHALGAVESVEEESRLRFAERGKQIESGALERPPAGGVRGGRKTGFHSARTRSA